MNPQPRTTTVRTRLVIAVVAAMTLAGCSILGSDDDPAPTAAAPTTVETTAAPAPTPEPTPTPSSSPGATSQPNGEVAGGEVLASGGSGFAAFKPDGWLDITSLAGEGAEEMLPEGMDPAAADAALEVARGVDWMIASPDMTSNINIVVDDSGASASIAADPEGSAQMLESGAPPEWEGQYTVESLPDGTEVLMASYMLDQGGATSEMRQYTVVLGEDGYYVTMVHPGGQLSDEELDHLDDVTMSLLDPTINPLA